MLNSVALLPLLTVFVSADTSVECIGPSIDKLCPTGYIDVSGTCCPISKSAENCADKTDANGVNQCPGLKSYCTNSIYKSLMTQQCPKTCGFCSPSACADLTNPATGVSDCAKNRGLCNNSLYKDLLKTQCPKTCGYCA